MSHPAHRPATYDDILAAPPHMVAEIVNGQLHTSPRPRPAHARAATALAGRLGPEWDLDRPGPGGWWILLEPELHLGEHVVVPDLAGWRRTRMAELPTESWFELAPDWICEVLSPSTALHDRARKLPVYGQAGVAWAWLVDPIVRTIEVFASRDREWVLHSTVGGEEDASIHPFEAVPLKVGSLWTSSGSVASRE